MAEAEVSYAVLEPPAEYRCVNCTSIFTNITGAVNEIHIYSANNEFEKSVTIRDAMAEIFDTPPLAFAQSTRYNILMCSNCAEILSYLYKYYLNFIGFSGTSAYVYKLIKNHVDRQQGQKQIELFQNSGQDIMELEISTDGEDSIPVSQIEFLEIDQDTEIMQVNPQPVYANQLTEEELDLIPIKARPIELNRRGRRSKGKFDKKGKKVVVGEAKDVIGNDPSKKRRIRHNQGIVKPRLFKCHFPSCDHTERFNYKMHEHIYSEHDKKEKTACVCGFTYYPEIYKPGTHVCYNHEPEAKSKKGGDNLNFQCEICGIVFKGGRSLWEHIEKVHISEDIIYTCQRAECGRKLDTRKQLIFHFDNHTEKRAHLCSECGMTFKLASTLRRHLEVHTIPLEERIRMNRARMDRTKGPVGAYKCVKCNNIYGRKAYLDIHIQFVHDTTNWKFKCPICEKPVPSIARLNKHVKIHDPKFVRRTLSTTQEGIPKRQRNIKPRNHLEFRPHVCTLCNKKFKYQAFLLAHTKTEHTERKDEIILKNDTVILAPSSQQLDEIEFVNADGAEAILVPVEQKPEADNIKEVIVKNFQMRDDEKKPWKCDQCEKTFSSGRAYGVHYKTHTGEIVLTQICPIPSCEENFQTKRHVENHLRKNHPIEEVKALPMDVLNDLGLDFDSLEVKKRFQCEICSNLFSSQSYLVRHIKSHSGLHKKIPCPLCEYKTSTRTLLRSHMRTNHPEDIPEEEKTKWSCDFCGKSFAGERNLREHRLIHTGEIFRFECPVCKEKFRSKTSQTSHTHAKHPETLTEEELDQYKCLDCNKRFNCKKNLTEHSRMHKGLHLKAECEYCGRKFRHQGVLKVHIEAIHANQEKKKNSAAKKKRGQVVKQVSLKKIEEVEISSEETEESMEMEDVEIGEREQKPDVTILEAKKSSPASPPVRRSLRMMNKKGRGRGRPKRKEVKVEEEEEVITPDIDSECDTEDPPSPPSSSPPPPDEEKSDPDYMEGKLGKKLMIKLKKV